MRLKHRLIGAGARPRLALSSPLQASSSVLTPDLYDRNPQVPSDILSLFDLRAPSPSSSPNTRQFYTLLSALGTFISTQPPHALPLSATLPDMHTSTESYVHLQKLYKARAEEEKAVFKELVLKMEGGDNVDGETVDSFLKNCHALKVLKGKQWGVWDADRDALGGSFYYLCSSSVHALMLIDFSTV
jgi:hypothetical protein